MRFAEAFQKEGLGLFGFTVQNEPLATTPWENCLYTAEEERDFVRDHLGPALQVGRMLVLACSHGREASGMDLKLLVWDHNRDSL